MSVGVVPRALFLRSVRIEPHKRRDTMEGSEMKTAAATAIAAASLIVAVAFAAPAAGGGVATHYTVHCADALGTTVTARSYDARQVELGAGKAHAIELFKQSNPGGHCWITGPHRDRPGTADSGR